MVKEKERFKYTTERRRQEELKRNPTASFSEGFNRATNGSLIDLANGLGWKGLGILILLLIGAITALTLF